MKVFVSYSRRDTEFVDRLDRDLTMLGHEVWIDRSDLVGGGEDRWRRSIVNAIRDSEAMLIVLSPNSVASENVERELSVAADNKKRVIPVLLRPCELPSGFEYELAGVQYIDFATMQHDEAVSQLSAQLRPVVEGAPEAPPPTPPRRLSGDTERLVRTFGLVGGGAVVALAIGLLVAALARDDDPTQAVEPPATTEATVTSAAATTTAPSSVTTTAEPAAPSTSDNSPSTTVDTTATTAPLRPDRDRAVDVVLEWFTATSARDWDRVREIDPNGLGQPYEVYYGGLDDTAHMESIEPYIVGSSEIEPGRWLIEGAIAAYDTQAVSEKYPTGYRTNFVCSTWIVDLNADPAPTSDWTGIRNHEFAAEGKLDASQFPAAYADWCTA